MRQDVLPDVEVFTAGKHRDDAPAYTVADLDAMVENFRRFSKGQKTKGQPRLRVPCVLGHEESQKFLEDSGLPAAAWVSDLRRKGESLYADLEDVPAPVRRLIAGKRYRTVSSEVYTDPPKGIPGDGCMLRRVAFLGGSPPEIKSISELPIPEHWRAEKHSEATPRFASSRPCRLRFTRSHDCPARGTVFFFSEVTPVMDKAALLEKIAQAGGSIEALQGCDEAALGEILRLLESQATEDVAADVAKPDGVQDGPEEHEEEAPVEEMPPVEGEQPVEDMEKHGEDDEGKEDQFPEPADEDDWKRHADHVEKSKRKLQRYIEHVNKCGEKYGRKYEEASPEVTTQTAPPAKKTPPGEGEPKVMAYAEQARRDIKGAAVEAFLDRMQAAGKVGPAERARLGKRLLDADDRRAEKFSENGKTWEETAYHSLRNEIESRPSYFGERVPAGDDDGKDGEADEQKVRKFAERHKGRYARMNQTPADVVNAFKSMKAKDEKLTADQFLTP